MSNIYAFQLLLRFGDKRKRVILGKEKVKIINRKACEKIQRGSPDIKPLSLSCQVQDEKILN
jgi:hypothetical protein